jgi:DNA polymerase-1
VGTDLTGSPNLEPGERNRILAWFQEQGYAIQSTSKHALAAVDHPAAQALLDWREAAKLTSTYEGYLDRLAGGRIFGRFQALGAASGRMSCGHPNLQNIPARLRPCVRAPEGRVLVSADYSGCELRIVASLSGDEALIAALLEEDFHSAVASRLFNKPVSKTENPELRHQAKGINFGLLYGMGAKSLGADLGITTSEARALMDRYFEGFPQLALWRRQALDAPKQQGFLRTRLGRRLAVERDRDIGPLALNFPVQGGGADLIKRAAVRVEQGLAREQLDASLVNMIHDELLLEASQAHGTAVATLVKREMITAGAELFKEVPMAVDAAISATWEH